ncbi:hypothetical protein MSAN_00171300 [Mycena sanguinolenta]|uniref:Uncharacterized protein n=1 Tax=Mycena sanguinolenta TaxID=230812 RepID=A0A8H6ZED9_9AGAR|nr:hypothetical protein MSAN_00171300 [Mycena sanguinolenta]
MDVVGETYLSKFLVQALGNHLSASIRSAACDGSYRVDTYTTFAKFPQEKLLIYTHLAEFPSDHAASAKSSDYTVSSGHIPYGASLYLERDSPQSTDHTPRSRPVLAPACAPRAPISTVDTRSPSAWLTAELLLNAPRPENALDSDLDHSTFSFDFPSPGPTNRNNAQPPRPSDHSLVPHPSLGFGLPSHSRSSTRTTRSLGRGRGMRIDAYAALYLRVTMRCRVHVYRHE